LFLQSLDVTEVPEPPFFILGCVRSGTTFLRDVLRRHPNFASPEETHFFRWAEPFGTGASTQVLRNNKTLVRHRALDGISEEEFGTMLGASDSRAALYDRYMQRYIRKTKPSATRWFDKTPQNVYGAALLASEFPQAKFLHLVRDPLDVVASLRVGGVMHVPQVVGACNYWIEAVRIMAVIAKAYPERVHEVRYEDLVADLDGQLERILDFLGEAYQPAHYGDVIAAQKQHDHSSLFTPEERARVEKLCGPLARRFGYFAKESA
jgi:hypothetical protein